MCVCIYAVLYSSLVTRRRLSVAINHATPSFLNPQPSQNYTPHNFHPAFIPLEFDVIKNWT